MDTTSREGRLQTSCRRYKDKISLSDVYKEKRRRGAREKGKGKKKEIKRLFTDQ
jgi:hypothetical protein